MYPFQYRNVGESLIHDIHEKIHSGESAVVLAARYAGKGYVFRELQKRLKTDGETPVIWVDPSRLNMTITEESLFDTILNAVVNAIGESADSYLLPEIVSLSLKDGLFSPLVHLADRIE